MNVFRFGVALVALATGLLLVIAACDSDSDGSAADAVQDVPAGGGECSPDPTPPGAEACPAVCTGGCDENNVCTVDCAGRAACEGETFDCPPDYACVVVCDGVDACDDGRVNCPAAYACTLVCEQRDACGDATLACGAGSCSAECGTDGAACEGTVVECGAGPCQATCAGSVAPFLSNCAGACSCTGC